jgi:hypothetical protein
MRVPILRALLNKEFLRHLANRGGLALALLLLASAVLLSVFDPSRGPGGGEAVDGTGLVGGIHHCYVEFNAESPFVDGLRQNLDPKLSGHVIFRPRPPESLRGLVSYEPGTGAIQIQESPDKTGRPAIRISVWHPKGETTAMAPYEAWFWKAARQTLANQADVPLPAIDASDDLWAVRESFASLEKSTGGKLPAVTIERSALAAQPLDLRSAVATGMVVFALYFSCVYLLPTLNCEERERGVLLAQALSPASPAEILAAKFLFYPTFGILLAAILAGIYKPVVLTTVFFWLAVFAVASAFLGIGMTVAAIAKTQRAAFLGSMCYLLSVSLVLFICSTNNIPFIPWLAVEYHGPRILHAAVAGPVESRHWLNLLSVFGLGATWVLAAGYTFRKRGWQ